MANWKIKSTVLLRINTVSGEHSARHSKTDGALFNRSIHVVIILAFNLYQPQILTEVFDGLFWVFVWFSLVCLFCVGIIILCKCCSVPGRQI